MKENRDNKQSATAYRSEQAREKLATGQITLAEYVGISRDEMYKIAQQAYQLMNRGKLEEARRIYSGLVAADPYDSVFHCHLGAVLFRMGEHEKAFAEYDAALRYNIANVDALAGRGELYIMRGEVKKGVEDLRAALEKDPQGERPTSQRARALLLSMREAARKQTTTRS
ncbi:MAG TPA: tetratricopeptide repeat protein [Pyrinomonadaceae bacterium]|jgi:tetratricopeptide (TPR) repeat protein